MRNARWIAGPLAVAGLAVALAGAALAEQGVTDDEVVIGTHQDLSGPITFWGVPVKNGMQMAVAEINAAGGVHGRTLKLVVEDSGYDPKKAVLATQKLLSRDEIFVMAGAMGTPTVLASMPLVLRQGLPHVFPLTAARQMYEPFDRLKFALVSTYYHAMRTGTKWMVEEKGKTRVCALYQDDEFGLNGHRGVLDQLAAMGMELVAETTYKRGATDFSSQIARLRAENCDLVTLESVIRETVGSMAEARKIGWEVDFLVNQAGYAPEVVMLGKEVVEGLYGMGFTPIPYRDTATPEVQAWMERYTETFGTEANIQAVVGYQVIKLTALGMENAGRELTVDSFVAGLEQIRDYTDMFGSTPVSFGPERRLGSETTFMNRVQGGRWVRLSEPLGF
jgi:ABC-type branched-subunit amino acid transport system substrate-binding protein